MQRPRISEATAQSVDKISSLPDTILSQILSRIPTKEAVATSILSKRWNHLWKFTDCIDFTDIILNDTDSTYSFNDFMYSILVSREASASHFLNRFTLQIEYGNTDLSFRFGFHNINKWINLVVQRGLKYLLLNIRVDFLYNIDDLPKLPASILTCTTLVSLDLNRFQVKAFGFSSIGFGLPSLNILHLNNMFFDEFRDFLLLLAGCPNLEHLLAVDIHFDCEEVDSPTIQEFKTLSLSKLISAHITHCWSSYFPVKALSNLESLWIDTFMFRTKHHKFYEEYQLQRRYDNIPIFHNLTRLELHGNWEVVAQVLQHCPKLQNLELYQEDDDQANWVEPELVPQCLSSYLRTCTIHDFLGLQCELMLAKYILKNARILQIMEIWNQREQPEIERTLSTCPKASATCQLLFH